VPHRCQPGDAIVRREVLPDGHIWLGCGVIVVEDTADRLVSYIPERAPLAYPPGPWPTPDGNHPWFPRTDWAGHGVLMIQEAGESYAVWHFWDGPERTFRHWYLNLQEPFRRTSVGYDTQDLELDLLVFADGQFQRKDWDLLPSRVEEGRFSQEQADEIERLGDGLAARLEQGQCWWDLSWTSGTPDPTWPTPVLPAGWERAS
jgi:hypothetical protein